MDVLGQARAARKQKTLASALSPLYTPRTCPPSPTSIFATFVHQNWPSKHLNFAMKIYIVTIPLWKNPFQWKELISIALKKMKTYGCTTTECKNVGSTCTTTGKATTVKRCFCNFCSTNIKWTLAMIDSSLIDNTRQSQVHNMSTSTFTI